MSAPAHPPPSKKIGLRPLAADRARACTDIGAGLAWEARDGAGPWLRFELRRLPGGRGAAGGRSCVLLTANGPLRLGGPALLHVGSGIALDAEWPAAVLRDAARLACAGLCGQLAAALGAGAECRIDFAPDGEAAEDGVDLLLTLLARDTGERHSFSLSATAATILRWLGDARWRRLGGARRALMSLPCVGQLWLGCTRMRRAELAALESGDAIRVEQSCLDALGAARVTLGRQFLNVTWAADRALQFDSWGNASMEETDDGTAPAGAGEWDEGLDLPGAMDELQFRVEFTVGRVQMTLAQLHALVAGSVIELEMAARPTVDISVGGRRLGTGELVDVDGALAVEVLHLRAGR